ncbi:MAG: ketopantoate reductase family protein [Acidobacteriota bacterium]
MEICIVGCGAIGSLFAAHLARLEEVRVYAYDINEEHVRAMREKGLRVTGEANFTASPTATTDPRQLPRCDYGIVVTKSMHTGSAIEAAAHAFDQDSAVCSIQNGAGNEEVLARHVRFVIRGTTFPAAHLVGPGQVCFDISGDTWMGPFEPTQTPMQKVRELASALTRAGLKTRALEDARGVQWTKLIFNASTNPVGALTRLHHGAASFFEPTGRLFDQLIDEGIAVATASGIQLEGDPRQMVRQAAQAPGKHNASMLQDVLAGRQTEIDFMNGAIVREGERLGVPTPLNRAMWALVRGLDHSRTNP